MLHLRQSLSSYLRQWSEQRDHIPPDETAFIRRIESAERGQRREHGPTHEAELSFRNNVEYVFETAAILRYARAAAVIDDGSKKEAVEKAAEELIYALGGVEYSLQAYIEAIKKGVKS